MSLREKIFANLGKTWDEFCEIFKGDAIGYEFATKKMGLDTPFYYYKKTGRIGTLGEHYQEIDAFLRRKLP